MQTSDSLHDSLRLEFEKATGIRIHSPVLGRKLTTFCIGGPLSFLIEPKNEDELRQALGFMARNKQKYRVLGAGSNLLISDQGVSDWVIRLGQDFRFVTPIEEGIWRVGAGVSLMTWSRDLSQAGFSGLEFAGGIPGSIGGAVRMNAGAHASEMSNLVREVSVMDATGEQSTILSKELSFAYRRCNLAPDSIVLAATIELVKGDSVRCMAKRTQFLSERKQKQPLTLPSAGSVFRNPSAQMPAGKLIEQAGLKGRAVGGARVSQLHANWIVNEARKASSENVDALIKLCQDRVQEDFGVKLETEIERW